MRATRGSGSMRWLKRLCDGNIDLEGGSEKQSGTAFNPLSVRIPKAS